MSMAFGRVGLRLDSCSVSCTPYHDSRELVCTMSLLNRQPKKALCLLPNPPRHPSRRQLTVTLPLPLLFWFARCCPRHLSSQWR
ncbi:hypothetical protein BDV34DRAFT_192944 [Aspergillus parasiticus]|uniref:Uncharacterized protein n=1 Tax=Aspergillus parasiticus TaxID=5067 RepID=A0A5N6DP02_ASPPA|nr:hypothetical protein BDV34DRAFT_192944 [Aspergillus parasiticus]